MRAIADLSLDEVVNALIGGETLIVRGSQTVTLGLDDSRKLLSFYNRDRNTYWTPGRNAQVVDGEIDRLLAALDAPVPSPPAAPAQERAQRRWHLSRVEANRFRGLHRHCGSDGSEPPPFCYDVSDVALLRGFNGAGKTSLLSAISWCLTGLGYRSQSLPGELHNSIEVRFDPSEGTGIESGGERNQLAFSLPPIVPIPSDRELVALGGTAKHDTWVRLTLVSAEDGTDATVERRLSLQRRGFVTEVTGLNEIQVGELALQVGTVMPAIVAAMRFEDKTTLSQALSVLTGLRPLAHFGERCGRLHDRLKKKYREKAEEARDKALADAIVQIATLGELANYEDAPDISNVGPPDAAAPDRWETDLIETRQTLDVRETELARDAELILSGLPDLSTPARVDRFLEDLEAARALVSGSGLAALPAFDLRARLSKLIPEEIATAESLISEVLEEGRRVTERAADQTRAARLRLYAMVAQWHEEAHPGEPFSACPLCNKRLGAELPVDAVLNVPVAKALEACRSAEASATQTAVEWEATAAARFLDKLSPELRRLADEGCPRSVAELCRTALVDNLFDHRDMPNSLARLRENAAAIWAELEGTASSLTADGTTWPGAIPEESRLRKRISNVLAAIELAEAVGTSAEFLKVSARRLIDTAPEDQELPANRLPLRLQIQRLDSFARAASRLRSLRRQIDQVEIHCKAWRAACARLTKLARAATAVEPFCTFPQLINDQIEALVAELNARAKAWAEKIYVSQFIGAPDYAGIDPRSSENLALLARTGNHVVSAEHVMNSSALRSFLWAYLLALWERLWASGGGLSFILMDDPQEMLDPANVANLAASIPLMAEVGIRPVVASNDYVFLARIESYLSARAIPYHAWEFSAISTSKCTASLVPVVDEIRLRFDAWREDKNNPGLARDFVNPVRVRIEAKLWDLLGEDPVTLLDPTLNDLLGRILNARNHGEMPFNEPPFRQLIELQALLPDAEFRRIINKAHHRSAMEITPAEAAVVGEYFGRVLSAIDACWMTYVRHMRRLPIEAEEAQVSVASAGNVVEFPRPQLPILGSLAARGSGAALVEAEFAHDQLSLQDFGEIQLFTLRAPTLGLLALPGQTLIVSTSEEIQNGDLAVILAGTRIFARRVGIDKTDPSRIALEALLSNSPNVPPTYFVTRSRVSAYKVIGVLFDDTATPNARGEAVPASESHALQSATAVARVSGDSAFPIAREGEYVFIRPGRSIDQLHGRVVAVVARTDAHSSERVAYLKRVGAQMPGRSDVVYLENVGAMGEGEYLQLNDGEEERVLPGIQALDKLWEVVGVIGR